MTALKYAALPLERAIEDPEIPEALKVIYRKTRDRILAGNDDSFYTRQMVHYFNTGECPPLLP